MLDGDFFVSEKGDTVHNGVTWGEGGGWILVRVKWFHLQNPDAAEHVPRVYKVHHKPIVVVQCNAISGKGTHILRTEQGKGDFQYDRSKQAYVMHPNVHHKLEKYGDTFAEQ
jgi:hypothetical protein